MAIDQIYKYEFVSSYRINKPKNPKKLVRISNKQHEENLESDEGLALLIPDIQDTANLVQVSFMQLLKHNINLKNNFPHKYIYKSHLNSILLNIFYLLNILLLSNEVLSS